MRRLHTILSWVALLALYCLAYTAGRMLYTYWVVLPSVDGAQLTQSIWVLFILVLCVAAIGALHVWMGRKTPP